jgi:Squalene-hopene cyclase C-terminal domain
MASGVYDKPARMADARERASAYLLAQADRQFLEVCHTMNFSRAAGFTGSRESQSSDIFARATLANLFLDIAELAQMTALSSALRCVARREAEYIACTRIPNRAGGWSYFPDLPELPPDADSLAAALSLFVRITPEYTELCREPVALVLASADTHGSFETWIVAPTDEISDRARMQWAIRNLWGTGADPDVMAHFYHALWLWEPDRYGDAIRQGASKLIEMQQPNGTWRATWYVGPTYGTSLSVRLLRKIGMGDDARARAYRFMLEAQHDDGSWGDQFSAPLQTALSIAALRDAGPGWSLMEMRCGAEALLELQLADGSWIASPWIQMEIGRAVGKIVRVATYQSATLSTAFCLRALLLSGTSISD